MGAVIQFWGWASDCSGEQIAVPLMVTNVRERPVMCKQHTSFRPWSWADNFNTCEKLVLNKFANARCERTIEL
jgi:hypothetical protein